MELTEGTFNGSRQDMELTEGTFKTRYGTHGGHVQDKIPQPYQLFQKLETQACHSLNLANIFGN